ncbi:MAG: hypothetical protein MOGMAGMI_02518 [Candidatus Omnitrophica bacterium]|nr:hypothetical protein [Candidatus Omnitrophota bacterium]
MYDIQADNDVLTVGGVDYPIRAVGAWTQSPLSPTLKRRANVNAQIKRAVMSGGERNEPTQHIAGLKITPLDPLSAAEELKLREQLNTPHTLRQCVVAASDGFTALVVEEILR